MTTAFVRTPPTSTYIVAFVISDFAYISNNDSEAITQRAYARPNGIDKSHLIFDVGVQMIEELGNYFGVNYSLPKIDQVGIPDFRHGAMENWGCVSYRLDI